MVIEDIRIDKMTPVPLYYQLKEAILNNIKEGKYEEGERIPNEKDFCSELDLSRTTVRQAITELVYEGWLYRIKSKGTFATKPKLNQDFVMKIEKFNDQMERLGMTPKTKVLSLKMMNADLSVAQNLGIEEKVQVIYLKRLRYANEEPIVIIETYLPYHKCGYIMGNDFVQESLYNILSQSKETRVCKVQRTIEAVSADSEDAELMEMKKGSPVHMFHTVGFNCKDEAIEYSIARYKGNRNRFDVTIFIE